MLKLIQAQTKEILEGWFKQFSLLTTVVCYFHRKCSETSFRNTPGGLCICLRPCRCRIPRAAISGEQAGENERMK